MDKFSKNQTCLYFKRNYKQKIQKGVFQLSTKLMKNQFNLVDSFSSFPHTPLSISTRVSKSRTSCSQRKIQKIINPELHFRLTTIETSQRKVRNSNFQLVNRLQLKNDMNRKIQGIDRKISLLHKFNTKLKNIQIEKQKIPEKIIKQKQPDIISSKDANVCFVYQYLAKMMQFEFSKFDGFDYTPFQAAGIFRKVSGYQPMIGQLLFNQHNKYEPKHPLKADYIISILNRTLYNALLPYMTNLSNTINNLHILHVKQKNWTAKHDINQLTKILTDLQKHNKGRNTINRMEWLVSKRSIGTGKNDILKTTEYVVGQLKGISQKQRYKDRLLNELDKNQQNQNQYIKNQFKKVYEQKKIQ